MAKKDPIKVFREVDLVTPEEARVAIVEIEEGGWYPVLIAVDGHLWAIDMTCLTKENKWPNESPVFRPASPTAAVLKGKAAEAAESEPSE